ncbi:MAG TPA: GNAT family N-acetyltransferase [Bryobacteraceae bacterium]|nr:GNAT family N-acetyltransferase [Bryobacteraceae bacterium]
MLRVHREAILSKAAGHYPQTTLDAWALGVTPDRVARAERQIADPEFIVLVAEAGDELIGYGVAIRSQGQLRGLYVKPNTISRVGSALLSELEKLVFRTAEFLTCDASLNAVGFYRAHGYAELGRTDHVLMSGANVPCMRMKKDRPAKGARG